MARDDSAPPKSPRKPRSKGRSVVGVWGPVLLVLAVLAAAFGSFQYDVARRLGWGERASAPALIAPPSGIALPTFVAPVPVADPLVPTVADPEAIRAVLAPLLGDKDLGTHVVAAVADVHGNVLFRGGTSPASTSATPASTIKLVTAVAALSSLGPDATVRTKVVAGATPGEIVLVGGGDPYLTDNPLTAEDSERPAPADLRTLAAATAATLQGQGATAVQLGFDDTLFSGAPVNPHWDPTDVSAGYAAPITSLWVDQGHPEKGPNTVEDPALQAAQVFARELRAAGIAVGGAPRRTAAPAGAQELAGIDSARMDQIAAEVLADSDNEGAEVLAHLVGLKEGFGASFDGGLQGIRAVLTRLGAPLLPEDAVYDGSGLSPATKLTADTLIRMLALGVDPAHPELRTIVTALPVAGFTGSLAERYERGPLAGRGRVAAKTGTLTGVHALAGVATTPTGATLLFVFLADQVKPEKALDARESLDVITSTLGGCLCN